MVNIPPIPPLLCSTPPPIDFGEDDEELDILPPSLQGVGDDDFEGFLTEDDSKTNEPLPSPRPPSVCDLSPVKFHDGLIPLAREDLKNHTITSPSLQIDNEISKDSKNNIKSINITEAFNFSVKNANDDKVLQDETNRPTMEVVTTETETSQTESNESISNSQSECSEVSNNLTALGLNEKVNDLTIELSNVSRKFNSSKKNISCMHNVVSIEDIQDDFSDDELYSPKTPKHFIGADNLNDYFKIEEIKTLNEEGNDAKFETNDVDSKSFDSLDNNDSASMGNENEFKSFSSNSFIQNKSDTPPPLPQDYANSIDDGDDDDDDFGDFADFQESHIVNNTVPVNDINIKQHENNLELNDFNDFTKYKTTKECTDSNATETVDNENTNESRYLNSLKDSPNLDKEFKDFNSNNATVSDVSEVKNEEISKENSLDLETISQEIPNYENESSAVASKTCEAEQHLDNEGKCFAIFNAGEGVNDNDDFGNFEEFSKSSSDCEKTSVEATESIEEPNPVSNDPSHCEDEFDDFAAFESHEKLSKSDEKIYHSHVVEENIGEVNDDDDDFGDFNTAEPVTPSSSSKTFTKTSQNTNTDTPVLPSNILNERISKILQLMFTATINPVSENLEEPKTEKIQEIPFTSIDAAKALEYQWLISDTRHSFIRSLGIDSRNILYGDNWNPSLPRFAANLSFNPLKPMKPVQSSGVTGDSCSILEPISINSLETTQTLEMTGCTRKEAFDLEWKSSSSAEQTIEASKENTITSELVPGPGMSMPYIHNEPPTTEPVSLTIFENLHDSEKKFSKTPPISEMESITTFSLPPPAVTKDMELPTTQAAKNVDDFDLKEIEEDLQNRLNINEVVVTSTFTGSFKETHIYTPTKINDFEIKQGISTTASSTSSSSPTKASPIDFDYEKAAMGVIIDETVVKKEYRDVEYNPPFTMESLSKSVTSNTDVFESNGFVSTNSNVLNSTDIKVFVSESTYHQDDQEANDDFSEFQSVSSEVAIPGAANIPKITTPLEVPKPTTVSHGGMILSPAILIPQAISMENPKPKIEWGDSTATINPEELARIEELFPEPKSLKSSNGSNSSQKSTPTHQVASALSISATVANKELERNFNNIADDDEDWSDFVSVTLTNNVPATRTVSNNNILGKSATVTPFKQRCPIATHSMPSTTTNNSNNDDEWSDFVSSAPASQQPNAYRVPQFNSGAWQNANFYNNPLSMYHKGPLNIPTAAAAATRSTQKSLYNNNNNCNISQQPYQIANNIPSPTAMLGNNIKQQIPNNVYHQQVHVMQNFSTAPVPTPERLSTAVAASKNNQFQSIGSAKVAPSIALIPDLGFVAPAIPTHTSFINSLPRPSINTKK